jgi:ABC-type lipoprotein release transport system permease subunit
MGDVTIVRRWLALELSRRWRSLAVLVLLIAVACGAVFAAVSGSRRGASALTRLQDRTLAATAAVYANQPDFNWDRVRALPGVQALGTFVVTYGVELQGLPDATIGFPPADEAVTRTIERPVILSGRLSDPSRADEAVVTPKFITSYHKGVGDSVVLRLPTPKQVADGEATDHSLLAGPRVRLHIVGIIRSPWLAVDTADAKGTLVPSAGLTATYRANLVGGGSGAEYINAVVRLRGGEASVASFRDAATKVYPKIQVVNLLAEQRQAQQASTFESRCLLAVGGAALIATLFLIGPAIVRYTAAGSAELHTMRAVGMTPRQAIASAAAAPAIAGIVGALLGAGGAIVASHWFPIGTATFLEPAPGISADWVVLGPGVAFVILAVIGICTLAGWRATRTATRAPAIRHSAVARMASRAGLPVPIVVGTRFALEAGRGRRAVPVRPALVGAVAGVLGILSAFTFAGAVSGAANDPARFGQTFQLVAYVGLNSEDFGPTGPLYDVLTKNEDVRTLNDVKIGAATAGGADTSVAIYSNTPVGDGMALVLTSGRQAQSSNEVVLAPRSADALHAGLGDTVTLTGDRGRLDVIVSGIGFVPQGPHNTYADGGLVTAAGYDKLFSGFQYHEALLSLRPGIDPVAAAGTLVDKVLKAIPEAQGFAFDFAQKPAQAAQLRQVRVLPLVLGFFLALLALGAVGHALATAVRRRSQDLAVLRALGMTPGQSLGVVATQGVVLAVGGLVFGVPLGVALGRSVWRAVADSTPLQYTPPPATWPLALIGPVTLLAAILLAAWPGRRAATLRIADLLRTE